MSNIFSAIVGGVIGGGLVATVMSLREKWQDELINSANFDEYNVSEEKPLNIAFDAEKGFHQEEPIRPVVRVSETAGVEIPNAMDEVPSVATETVDEPPLSDEEKEWGMSEKDRAEAIQRMIRRNDHNKKNRATRTVPEKEQTPAPEVKATETDAGEPSGEYDPWTGIYKDGTFEVELGVKVSEEYDLSNVIPTDFGTSREEGDKMLYVTWFNKLVEDDRVIPFDYQWLDKENKMTCLSKIDHRRHEKGFFAAVSEDESETAILHISRKGVTGIRFVDTDCPEGRVEWATTRRDLDHEHMDRMGSKERLHFRNAWETFKG